MLKGKKFQIPLDRDDGVGEDSLKDLLGGLDPNESVLVTFVTLPNSVYGAYTLEFETCQTFDNSLDAKVTTQS